MALGLLGTASTLGIGLSVFMDDQFTQASSRISNTLKMMGKDVDDFSQGMATISNIGDTLSRFGDKVLRFGTDASQEFATFEHSINATRVIAGLKKTDSGYKELGDTALRLSSIYGQLPEAIGNAELELAKGGKTVAQIKSMTEAVVALGAATQTPVQGGNGTATVLLNIMQAYNAQADQALHYANIITSAANQSTIDVRDLFESLRYSADVASTLKIPFEETASAIAALGNAGLKGSMAGTAYANMLRYLESGVGIFATKRQQTALGLLGLSKKDMIDEQGHIISMSNLLKILKDRTSSFDDNNKINVLGGIFGVRGNRALLNLINGMDRDSHGTMMGSYDAMRDKIHQDITHDVTTRTAKEMLDDTVGVWSRITSAWTQFKIAIGGTLVKAFAPLGNLLITLLNGLTNFVQSQLGQWVTRFVFGSGLFLSILGRAIVLGARFAAYIVGSAGRLTNGFKMAEVASLSIRAQLQAGATAITNAALAARGISTFTNKTTGAQMLAARNAAGQFVGGRVARSALSTTLGTLLGRTGLRWASSIERFIAPLISAGSWIGRTVGIVRVFGAGLGKALGWLFGWEGMLADLVLTMATGKGIFEWLWAGLRTVFGWLFGETDKQKSKGRAYNAQVDERGHYAVIDRRSQSERDLEARMNREHGVKAPAPVTYVFHILPNNTNQIIKKEITVKQERQMQSYNLIK